MCMSNFCMSTELVPRIDTLVTRYNRTATPFSRTATAASDRQGRTNCPSDYPWARSSPSPSARFGRRCTAVRPVEPPELSSAHRPAGVWVMRADQLVAQQKARLTYNATGRKIMRLKRQMRLKVRPRRRRYRRRVGLF